MPRVEIPIQDLEWNGAVPRDDSTEISDGNGGIIQCHGHSDSLILEVYDPNDTGTMRIGVRAGVGPPAFRSSLGPLFQDLAGLGSFFMGPLESARFIQPDGSILIDEVNDSGGTYQCRCFRLPGY